MYFWEFWIENETKCMKHKRFPVQKFSSYSENPLEFEDKSKKWQKFR